MKSFNSGIGTKISEAISLFPSKDVRVRLSDGRSFRASASPSGSTTDGVNLRAAINGRVEAMHVSLGACEIDLCREGDLTIFRQGEIASMVSSGHGRNLRQDAIDSLLLYRYVKMEKSDNSRVEMLLTVTAIDGFLNREYGFNI
jgi:hypothetical protein